jgi:hypothetical protein
MGPIQVVVEDGNNIVLEVTPTPDTTVILDRGVAGSAATVAVGTTTSLPPGSPATVTNVGTSAAAVLNFGIPTAGGIAAGGSTTQVQYNLSGVLAGSPNMTFNGTTLNVLSLTEATSPVVVQTDIGSAPNEIPLNQYLGNLAYQDAANIAGPVGVGGALTVVGATTLAAATMASATVTNAVEAGGGAVAEQLVVDNFTAASSAVLRGGSTNLLTYSEDFANAAWTKTRASITANTIVAPDGTLTGDKLVEDTTASATHLVSVGSGMVAGNTYTYSVYAKPAGRDWMVLSPGGAWGFAWFNISSGTIGTVTSGGSSATAAIQPVGNGWYRCSVTATAVDNRGLQILISTGNNVITYTGDGTSGVFIWGAQLNVGSTPAAYLQTVANAVTTAYAAPIESPNGLAFPLLATMTPARNADMTFQLTSNTSLVVKVRGSDGTVRSATLTLA